MAAEYDSEDTGDITLTDSYKNFDYGREIPSFRGFRLTDMIDARPRVNNFTVTEGSRSPFEFKGESSMVPQLNTVLRTFLQLKSRLQSLMISIFPELIRSVEEMGL